MEDNILKIMEILQMSKHSFFLYQQLCSPISKSMKPKKWTQFFLQWKFHCDEESNGVLSPREPQECCFLHIANDTSGLTKSKMGSKYSYDVAERTVNVLFLECYICGKALNLLWSLASNVLLHIQKFTDFMDFPWNLRCEAPLQFFLKN